MTLIEAVRDIAGNHQVRLIRYWNWKSALLGALIRGAIFFAANYSAGWQPARAAMCAEIGFGLFVSGFYGSLVQVFAGVEPAWQAALTIGLLLPSVTHTFEFLIHWFSGTPNLGLSVFASVLYSGFAMLFNLHLMRQQVLIVGENARPLHEDLRRIPALIVGFFISGGLLAKRAVLLIRNRIPNQQRGKLI